MFEIAYDERHGSARDAGGAELFFQGLGDLLVFPVGLAAPELGDSVRQLFVSRFVSDEVGGDGGERVVG